MSYQVTARKWRPLVFDDVVGQSHVANTLRNALAQNRLAHAFIFSGTRGCGKTSTARILARAVNCLTPKNFEPCNECEICKEIIEGRSLDVIEIDGASNRGVDEIRNLRESVRYAPTRGKKKVYIIDEVHMLTKEAFNALLKTLEEPPPHALFIFATTELHKVPATILSRCQRHDFRRISIEEIVDRLKFIAQQETITIDDDSLLIIAKKGDGSMRDAQSIFDQVVSFCGTTIAAQQVADALNIVDLELFFKASDAVKAKDTKRALELVEEVINSGYEVKEFVSGLLEHFRNMLVAKTTQSTHLIEESQFHRKRYAEDASSFSLHDLLRIIKVVTDTENAIRFSVQPRFKLEVMMVQLTKMETAVNITELLARIDELSKGTGSSASPLNSSEKKKLYAEHALAVSALPFATAVSEKVSMFNAPSLAEEIKPKYTFSSTLQTAGDTAQPVTEDATVAVMSEVTIAYVQEQWGIIVETMRKKRISVGTVLGETKPLEIINGALRIGCDDEFHRSTLLRNKEILTDTINSILSSKLRIDPVLQEGVGLSSSTIHRDVETKTHTASDNHPIIQALYKEFGAERIG
jgi:DNA polymerase-3 subunit gamma/tau